MLKNKDKDPNTYKGTGKWDSAFGKGSTYYFLGTLIAFPIFLAKSFSDAKERNIGELKEDTEALQEASREIGQRNGWILHAIGIPAGIIGGVLGWKKSIQGAKQHEELLKQRDAAMAENEMLKTQVGWLEKTGKKPSDFTERMQAEKEEQKESSLQP